ncbi:uncharacterized protein SPPG_08662 [Spizellomyces punctatus DAOM BR117]|uniref:Uncharacterized protein n=1 Tax=Spizellomyces punctatus (strain DAOM BR117) TaxID=645134 RepID=A0A0L0H359_SPIPD|nr:uncharacterized protein SPPG_08662 [Spizellomyces punctatus DAOM BR117]KNC95900.1 hypothetical protein SPPG_08662 [Spizellomyces punctatus DAOM BR117]|eukprot:XP_016603940.1 hypothetical protein SPPG_08662 [Spizellomyces punctatus DAOM BR117]
MESKLQDALTVCSQDKSLVVRQNAKSTLGRVGNILASRPVAEALAKIARAHAKQQTTNVPLSNKRAHPEEDAAEMGSASNSMSAAQGGDHVGAMEAIVNVFPALYRDRIRAHMSNGAALGLLLASGIMDCAFRSLLVPTVLSKEQVREFVSDRKTSSPRTSEEVLAYVESVLNKETPAEAERVAQEPASEAVPVPGTLLKKQHAGSSKARDALYDLYRARRPLVKSIKEAIKQGHASELRYAQNLLREFLFFINSEVNPLLEIRSEGWISSNVLVPLIDKLFAREGRWEVVRGETCSSSSSERMQREGNPLDAKPSGHKLDGAVHVRNSMDLEILIWETKPVTVWQDRKAVTGDRVKLIRGMKDALDKVIRHHDFHLLKLEKIAKVEVYGIQTSAFEVVGFVANRSPEGATIILPLLKFDFPTIWDERCRLLNAVEEMLRLKARMVEQVNYWASLQQSVSRARRQSDRVLEPLPASITQHTPGKRQRTA